jgi:Fe2+ transport system protein FeoA
MKLSDLAVGVKARVIGVEPSSVGASRSMGRLSDMGLVPGLEVEVLHKLPWNGPLIIRWSSTRLVIRQDDASCIEVQE